MRFHVKYNDVKIFIGFTAKNHRFVFYTHGKVFTARGWKKFIESNRLLVFDEDGFPIDWEQFIKYVDHLQYFSNTYWVNKFFISEDGYNFSDNRSEVKSLIRV